MRSNQLIIRATCTLMGLCLSAPLWAQSAAPEAAPEAATETAASVVTTPRRDSHTISNATGWMLPAGEVEVALALDQDRHPVGAVSLGLGDLAEFGVNLQRERSDCSDCDTPENRSLSTAYFKVGLPEGTGHEQVPGISVVFRKALPKTAQLFSDPSSIFSKQDEATPTAMLTAMVSKAIGPAAIHVGAELLAAQEGDDATDTLPRQVRPALGLQYIPAAYPETTLVADVRWIPSRNADDQWDTVWNAAWGIRYQALDWASVDLNLRHQEGESAGDAIATLGVRGFFDLTGTKPKPTL